MKAPKQQGALPTLPAPDRTMWQYGKQIDHYTADQMRDVVLAERARWVDAVMNELDGNGQAHAIVAAATGCALTQ
jgi:hypothetical protein